MMMMVVMWFGFLLLLSPSLLVTAMQPPKAILSDSESTTLPPPPPMIAVMTTVYCNLLNAPRIKNGRAHLPTILRTNDKTEMPVAVGTKIDVHCFDGYRVKPGSVNGGLVCNETGHWQLLTKCVKPSLLATADKPVKCHGRPYILNSIVEPTFGQYHTYDPGYTEKVRCRRGYVATGNGTFWCTEKGTWEASTICQRIASERCSVREVPVRNCHVMPVHGDEESLTKIRPGQAIRADCNEGYDLKGNGTLTCLENGSWSLQGNLYCHPARGFKSLGQPRLNCSMETMPTIKNGYVQDLPTSETVYGESRAISCKTGYMPSIDDQPMALQCNVRGEWQLTNSEAECIRDPAVTLCQGSSLAALNISNGQIDLPGFDTTSLLGREFVPGDNFTTNCDEGFKPSTVGSAIRCAENGSWLVESTCEKDRDACRNVFPLFNHGAIVPIENRLLYRLNETLRLRCDAGYEAVGSGLIHCTSFGQWMIDTCCQPPSTFKGAVEPTSLQAAPPAEFSSSADR